MSHGIPAVKLVESYKDMPAANSFVSIKHQDMQASELVRYDAFVAALFKQETFRHMIDHARGGVCEEAGELSSWLKRHVVYGKALYSEVQDEGKTYTLREKIVEEMGDLRFFLQAIQNLLEISEQEILQANAEKLGKRYAGLIYSDAAANARADKTEGESNV